MRSYRRRWLAFMPLAMLGLSMLACGGFQMRSTTATATVKPTTTITPTAAVAALAAATPTATPRPTPTAAPSPSPAPGVLATGSRARVAADTVNVRAEAKSSSARVGSLPTGTVVTVKGGPINADNYSWYQIDNGSGITGWAAAGPANAPWLVADTSAAPTAAPSSGPRLVNRPIKVGDTVQVTTQGGQLVNVRTSAGKDAEPVARATNGTQFTVKSGPEDKDGFKWWQVEGEQYKGWAAEGDGDNRWLTPVER